MTVGFFVPRAAIAEVGASVRLFDAHPSVRALYQDVSAWTGQPVAQILSDELPEERGRRNALLAIRSITAQLAAHDVLVEARVQPRMMVALSLGISTAAAMIGALAREDLFRMLWYRRDLPGAGPNDGSAFCHLDAGTDVQSYIEPRCPGVHLGVDFGLAPDGESRNVILSGRRDALERLAEKEPDRVTVMPRGTVAGHSPLRRPASDFLREHLDTLTFHEPRVPLAACLDDRLLTTAAEVREAMWSNPVRTASIPTGVGQAIRVGVRLLIIPGSAMLEGLISFPMPTLVVREPEDVVAAVTAVEQLERESAKA